jgi:hypothetical protein
MLLVQRPPFSDSKRLLKKEASVTCYIFFTLLKIVLTIVIVAASIISSVYDYIKAISEEGERRRLIIKARLWFFISAVLSIGLFSGLFIFNNIGNWRAAIIGFSVYLIVILATAAYLAASPSPRAMEEPITDKIYIAIGNRWGADIASSVVVGRVIAKCFAIFSIYALATEYAGIVIA